MEEIEILIAEYTEKIKSLNVEVNTHMENSHFYFSYHKSGQIQALEMVLNDLNKVLNGEKTHEAERSAI